jgi:hypothetical protein
MNKMIIYVIIITIIFTGCTNELKEKNTELLPFYGVWNPLNTKSGYTNEYTEFGLYKAAYDSINILPSKGKKVKNEIAIVHDIAWDIRIIKIEGDYPKYTIKFMYDVDIDRGGGNYESKWYSGEMIIHFKNRDEIWFELTELDSYSKEKEYPKKLIKFGPKNIYRRAEKLDKPIIPDAP